MTNKKTILFVVNQLSGTVASYNVPKCIEMFLDLDKFEYRIAYIDHDMDEEKYSKLLGQAKDILVSVGGDGTLLELGQKMMNQNVILGIIPVGSGNGLATHLGYKPRDVEAAFRAINQLKIQPIDVAKINNDYFFSNFGVGLDAAVARDFKIKKRRSLFVYAYLTIKRVIQFPTRKITFKTTTKSESVESYLFNVFNSNLFGYGVGLLPWANAFDGKLDVGYIRKTNILSFTWAGICILIKKPKWSRAIKYFSTDEITIYNDALMEYQVDGDPKTTKGNLTISVIPKQLSFIIP